MIGDVGFLALMLALLLSIYAATAALFGGLRARPKWVESARNATVMVFPLTLISCAALVYAILTDDFSIEYVWRVTSIETPRYLKFTALWGGQAGSLLFWNMLLAAFTGAAMLRKWDSDRGLMPYAIFTASLTQIFFLAISAGLENPFTRLAIVPPDGNGLNPLLRHPGMIIHPPMLYLGFVGFTIPFAFAMAALIRGELNDAWIRTTRRWTLIAWLFLSLGLILGGRWAYDVLGWGGYWAWDPVENASFMPWLAGTAFLHSVMIQEKTGMFKGWSIFLIIVTYLLTIYGTFIVRSGLISSVHSFAQSPIGPAFLRFFAVMLLFSIVMIILRLEQLESRNRLRSLLSREAAFLLNNFIIMGILAATFWGTNYPIISEWLTGEQITVGKPFYEKVNGPLFAALLLLMGIAPLIMWYRTSLKRLGMALRGPAAGATLFVALLLILGIRSWGALLGLWIVGLSTILTVLEFWKGTRARMKRGENAWNAFNHLIARNRRRYGGYWIHLGVLIMGFGIIGSTFFQQETQIFLARGQTATLGDFAVTFNGIRTYEDADDLIVTEADLSLSKGDRALRTLNPRSELYSRTGQTMTIPASRPTVSEDFYALLINWESVSNAGATIKLYLNPLINWVWAGGLVFIFGTIIAAWPDPADERLIAAAKTRTYVPAVSPGD